MSLSDLTFPLDDLAAAENDTANPYLADPAKGLQLITRLIAHPPPQRTQDQRQHLAHLHQLIHQSFVSLAARDDFQAEAQAFRELLALEESLHDLALFPDLANKTIVGVGGGFSAGKSRFLNTLLGDPLLPESVKPTTAIPSFLTDGAASIVALNVFNHQVEIDADALQAISHAFVEHYKKALGNTVGFAHVLKLLMIHRPAFKWANLAFLDTPGYSKVDGGNPAASDQKIALKQLAEADHLVWLLSAQNGSIQQGDLEFLRTLNHAKPIFFVVTQCDLKSKQGIGAILESTRRAIDSAGLSCAGLMAWAAPLSVQVGEKMAGDDIGVWLQQLNASPKFTTKRRMCARVMDNYIQHNSHALAHNRSLLSAFNELLPLAMDLPDNRKDVLTTEISRLRNDQHRLTALIQEFSALKDEMLDAVTQIVGKLAQDEAIKSGHELIYFCKCERLKRFVQADAQFAVRVVSVNPEIKKVIVVVGDDVVTFGLSFGMIRGDLRIDPLVLVKGSLLAAEVRSMDAFNVTFAITNPNATE